MKELMLHDIRMVDYKFHTDSMHIAEMVLLKDPITMQMISDRQIQREDKIVVDGYFAGRLKFRVKNAIIQKDPIFKMCIESQGKKYPVQFVNKIVRSQNINNWYLILEMCDLISGDECCVS